MNSRLISKLRKGEKGFTIVEITVAIAISAIIVAGAGMTAIQSINIAQSNKDITVALRQADNVGLWFGKDIIMAQTANITDDPSTSNTEVLSIFWKDWETGDTYDIRYILLDSADSLKKIRRIQLTLDKNGAEVINKATLLADNIYTANVSSQDNFWTLNVEARCGDKSSLQVYKAGKRLES